MEWKDAGPVGQRSCGARLSASRESHSDVEINTYRGRTLVPRTHLDLGDCDLS